MTTETHMGGDPAGLQPNAPAEEVNRVFQELRELNKACAGSNSHSRAIVLIHACIDNGINTRGRIRGALEKLGFNGDHAVTTLNKGTGNDPALYHWRLDEAGIYRSHPNVIAPPG